ncbi:hypothetical protein Tco_0845492 [Tanacetum coccineum]
MSKIVFRLLGVGSKNKIFHNFLELVWIRRIGPPGYGVSDLLDTAYRTYWVRRIELLRYGVLGSLGAAYWATLVDHVQNKTKRDDRHEDQGLGWSSVYGAVEVTPLASSSFPKRPTAHVVNLEKVREQLGVPEVPIRVLDQPEHPPREFSNQPEQLQP